MPAKSVLSAAALLALAGCAHIDEMQTVLDAGRLVSSLQTAAVGSSLQSENASLEYRNGGTIRLRYNDGLTIQSLNLKASEANAYLSGFNRWIALDSQASAKGLRGFETDIRNVSNREFDLSEGTITGGIPVNFPITMVFRVDDRGRSSMIVKGRGAYDIYSRKVVLEFAKLLQRRGQARSSQFQLGRRVTSDSSSKET